MGNSNKGNEEAREAAFFGLLNARRRQDGYPAFPIKKCELLSGPTAPRQGV